MSQLSKNRTERTKAILQLKTALHTYLSDCLNSNVFHVGILAISTMESKQKINPSTVGEKKLQYKASKLNTMYAPQNCVTVCTIK